MLGRVLVRANYYCLISVGRLVSSSLFCLGLMLPVNVQAQDAKWNSLYDKILRIESRIEAIEKKGTTNNYSGRLVPLHGGDSKDGISVSRLDDNSSDLVPKVNNLENRLGNIEQRLSVMEVQLLHLKQQQKQISNVTKDPVAKKIDNIASNASNIKNSNSVGNYDPAAKPSNLGTMSAKAIDPDVLYNQAYGNLVARDFTAAEVGFKFFLEQYPRHKLAGNSQYWLGETYYARGKYKDSAKFFLEGYKKYRQSAKAPDSLLKLGLSLKQLKKTAQACATFAQIDKEFPNASSSVNQRAKVELDNFACK